MTSEHAISPTCGDLPATLRKNAFCLLSKPGRVGPVPVRHLLRFFIAGVFILSGLLKLADLKAFATVIGDFGLLPESLVFPAAWALALGEVVGGGALVLDYPGSLEVLAGLMAFFMAVLSYGILMGLDMDCGCFGPLENKTGWFKGLEGALARDGLLLGIMAGFYAWRYTVSRRLSRRRDII